MRDNKGRRLRSVVAISCVLALSGGLGVAAIADSAEDGHPGSPPGEPSPTMEELEASGDAPAGASSDDGATPQSHPTIHMKTVAATAFTSSSGNMASTTSTTGCLNFNSSEFMRYEVELPHGTDPTAVFMHAYNEVDASPMSIELRETSYSNGSTDSTVLAEVTASGDAERNVWGELVSGSNTINNQNSYLLRLQTRGGGQLCGVQLWFNPDTDDGLVFHPVEPCAAFDTRPSQGGQGKLTPGEDYTFRTRNNLTDQGGAEDDCGVPSSARAVQVNLVAIGAEGTGNLRIWPANGDLPDGGVVNFTTAGPNSNALSVGVNRPFSGDRNVDVRANGYATHVRGVILGYYERTHPQIN